MTIECKLQRNIHTYLQTHIHSDKERERERKESKITAILSHKPTKLRIRPEKKMHKENNEKLTTIHS